MKISLLIPISFLAVAMAVSANPADKGGDDQGNAPAIEGHLKHIQKRIKDDIASNALTKPDADELTREVNEVQSVIDNEPKLTGMTRHDLREKMGKIEKDLDLKEQQAKAISASGASPTPASSLK